MNSYQFELLNVYYWSNCSLRCVEIADQINNFWTNLLYMCVCVSRRFLHGVFGTHAQWSKMCPEKDVREQYPRSEHLQAGDHNHGESRWDVFLREYISPSHECIKSFLLCPHRKSCQATRTLCDIWIQPLMQSGTVYGRFWFWWSIARVIQLWCKQNYGLNMQSKVISVCPCVILKILKYKLILASQYFPLTVVWLSL